MINITFIKNLKYLNMRHFDNTFTVLRKYIRKNEKYYKLEKRIKFFNRSVQVLNMMVN